jgi:hypothetical protein
MKNVFISLKIFGFYSLMMGLTLFFVPQILPFFGINAEINIWTRMLGFVLSCSSYYYIKAATIEDLSFAKWTIHTRFIAPFIVAYLVVFGFADPIFILFGVVDGLGGLITYYFLNKSLKNPN